LSHAIAWKAMVWNNTRIALGHSRLSNEDAMPRYISGIFLDFDNVFSSLFKQSKEAAKDFATDPARWLGAFQGMRGSETEDTSHNFVIRRCYMNPVGRIASSEPFSNFRQSFVRDGWEVIDTPPLTNQGKTSADTHIVMDVLDSVTHYPHVDEYVIMAADADYTPLVIRLRKHMKTTVVYAAMQTSVAYRAACDSIIDERSMLEILEHDDEEPTAESPASTGIPSGQPTPEKVADTVERYYAESEQGHRANVATLGHMLNKQFPGISDGWIGHPSLSQLLRKVCKLKVENIEGRTMAWKD
jgi:NYN domain